MRKVFTILFAICNVVLMFSQSAIDTCISCDLKPGEINKFKGALENSKLHYYTDEGKTKLDLKKAEKECNVDYFGVCNNKLVLISSGKKKDRTEIRQHKKLSLNTPSRMFFKASIYNTPKANAKKGVTIAQIHSSAEGVKRPLLRVEVAGGKEIWSVLTSNYLKGEGKVKHNLLVPFTDGDEIICTLEIKKFGNRVSVEIFNTTKGERKKRSYEVSRTWRKKDKSFYFKAGAYTQVSGPKTTVVYDEFRFE